jgi:hypothetical protein
VLGITAQKEQSGVWRLQGGPAVHPMWLLETESLADVEHPLLVAFSPQFLRDTAQVSSWLRAAGYNDVAVYVAQQLTQFHKSGEEFAMVHQGADKEMYETLLKLIKELPFEDRIRFVSLDEIPVEERLKGVHAEELLKYLPADEVERLRILLRDEAGKTDTR